MPWFTPTQTYVKTIKDPESDETATVTLRPLNAQDRAAIEDTLQMHGDSEGQVTPQMKLGTMRMLTVTRATVDWSIPGPKPNETTIASLDPRVFEQLWDAVSFGTATEDPTQQEKEDEHALVAVS